MNIPVRKAAIILTKGDDQNLARVVQMAQPFFNKIFIGHDHHEFAFTDNCNHVQFEEVNADKEGFGKARTMLDKAAKDYRIHVHIDTDEVWDPNFLANLAENINEENPVHRLARCNMPDGHAFPDYQVRAFWYVDGVEWRGALHERVYRDGMLYDQWKNVQTAPHVIVHLPRKKEMNRPWWNQ